MKQRAATTADNAEVHASSAKFRTTPIKETITQVKQLPKSAILYQCAASKYWQFRVYLDGAQRKRSTQKTDLADAQREAKLIYASMLQSIHGNEQGALKLSGKRTLQSVAASLWDKQDTMIAQGELNPQKNRTDQYIFQKHIQPFFKDYEIKEINADKLEQFKLYLARCKLAKSSQKAYFTVVSKLLQEAVKKNYIHNIPLMPRVRMDDDPRGYFDPTEYTVLWKKAESLDGKSVPVYKDTDYVDGELKAGAKPYRNIKITHECYELIMFMRNTYVRPTDIKVLKHKHVRFVTSGDIEFLELHHPTTKRHHGVMTSTEYAANHYRRILAEREKRGSSDPNAYIFMPQHENREYALKELTRQFDSVLRILNLKQAADGKNRTLYSLRHTAIVTGIKTGISEQTLAINARTSVDMIDRFYGSHMKSVLKRGNEVVEKIQAKQRRHAEIAEVREQEKLQKKRKINHEMPKYVYDTKK